MALALCHALRFAYWRSAASRSAPDEGAEGDVGVFQEVPPLPNNENVPHVSMRRAVRFIPHRPKTECLKRRFGVIVAAVA
jgi:hypothetical protein